MLTSKHCRDQFWQSKCDELVSPTLTLVHARRSGARDELTKLNTSTLNSRLAKKRILLMKHRWAEHESKQQRAMVQLLKIGMYAKRKAMEKAQKQQEEKQKKEHAKLQESITTSIMPGGLSAMSITAPLSLNWGADASDRLSSMKWGMGDDDKEDGDSDDVGEDIVRRDRKPGKGKVAAEGTVLSSGRLARATRMTGMDRIKSMKIGESLQSMNKLGARMTAGFSFFGGSGKS